MATARATDGEGPRGIETATPASTGRIDGRDAASTRTGLNEATTSDIATTLTIRDIGLFGRLHLNMKNLPRSVWRHLGAMSPQPRNG